ncbi:helix-turn-helix transcriptional regulator [Streptomyces sp. MNU89]|uniref:helix-turn-helix domain-containing protein n=1 Tax=Streptomyces sp. MNU89 TaxID=2560025 RepID=UPI001E478D02|nr:helix-turn-helix transcriptional regulator [Streptomyces sp. MNU89]MCC9741292.1 helix-turn-helix domain-containing protein [Streptomyces sp. MNU89]
MNKAHLGTALRALRRASGREAKSVARGAVMSASKLSKIENGRLAPSVTDVERILGALGVSDEIRREYVDAARAAATEATAWWHLKRIGADKGQREAQALEAQMTTLRLFQPALVPGLLQTPEYMRAVLVRHELSEDVLTRTINGRLMRQHILYEQSKTLRFVITEPVLRWRLIPPRMMAAQMDRLLSASRLPNVDIRVVPLDAPQTDIANHAFVIRDVRLVTVETVHAELVVTDTQDVELYVRKFENFAKIAARGPEMTSLLEKFRDAFLREEETG